MEVHHHPDLKNKNKRVKEYFLEFLMIFLAVTMGFLAENIRESVTKHEREEHLMGMLIEDLKTDNDKLDSAIIKNNIKLNKLDTLRTLVYASANNELPDTSIKKMYYLYRLYAGNNYFFEPTQRTLSQFEKTDAFNLLRNQDASDAIVEYNEYNKAIEKQAESFHEFQFNAAQVGETIFNGELLENFKSRDSAEVFLRSTQKYQLMTKDKQILLLYGNKLFMTRAVLLNYIKQLNNQKQNLKDLKSVLEKKYHLEAA